MSRVEISQNIGTEAITSINNARQSINGEVIKTEHYTRHSYQVITDNISPKTNISFKVLGMNADLKSPTWSPSQAENTFGIDACLWIDASDKSTITLHAGCSSKIKKIKNKGSSSGYLINNNPSTSPVYNSPSGLVSSGSTGGSISFDGFGQILTGANDPCLEGQEFMIFIVGRFLEPTNHPLATSNTLVSYGDEWRVGQDTNNYNDIILDITDSGLVLNPNKGLNKKTFLSSSLFSELNTKRIVRYDGTERFRDNADASFIDFPLVQDAVSLGGYGAVGDFYGEINEVIIIPAFEDPNSSDKIKNIEGYLAKKWGLTQNLPSNHPFYEPWIGITRYNIIGDSGKHGPKNKDGILYFDFWNFKYAKCSLYGTFSGSEKFKVIEKHNA
jgi:hypothetical protein